jgi:hypothetical protein
MVTHCFRIARCKPCYIGLTRHPHLCPFLTEQGCSLRARPVICVNFICQRLSRNITHENLVRLQEVAGEEIAALFTAEEYVKKKIASISL